MSLSNEGGVAGYQYASFQQSTLESFFFPGKLAVVISEGTGILFSQRNLHRSRHSDGRGRTRQRRENAAAGTPAGGTKEHSWEEHRLQACAAADGTAGATPPLNSGIAPAAKRVRAPHPTQTAR